ncbi:hypothetical protein G7074_13990 [Pedobacter sp. HDW13]|uniref:hypothetical protein n=1 Tax=Pedobacter sp. HDW13 TaxID=2714940 RepID=UPI00140AF750|nr:hypothetical protein [Pedobacter sp. HDW13]QIL40273.1 hypothetical protein G7074_13990 [Pedobacter sp. HDW13]
MKKLKLNQTNFAGAEVLSRAQLKNVMGGTGSCGVKVNGTWCTVSGGASTAEGMLGTTQTCNGGEISGTVTNWCCDSCYWN